MQVQRIMIYLKMSLGNVYRCMVRHTIRVVYLKREFDILYGNRQIRVFKITVLHIQICVIRWKMFFVVFSFYKSIKINLSVRFNTGEIFLIDGGQHRKDIFELCGRRFEFDIHAVTAVIYPLKESFSMQFQIIERYLVSIKGITMGIVVNIVCQIYDGFSCNPARDRTTKIKIDRISCCSGIQRE